ncbi:MAG: Asp-tRNA(Asn)/Glu-tRNA(Gln) amidotransferase subunit GatC [Clostridiales bacterium]|nr:Asp-tRNA(Asn)/Glu-tRNA(Gln) amidotransferase subunit GatC [Clostridiales bacterium]
MTITMEKTEQIAKLCKLELSAEEEPWLTGKMAAVVDFVGQLQEADIAGVDPTINVLPLKNVFREDETISSITREQALALAPESEGGYFRVPSIL